jgi:hypothetical protein
MNQRLLSKTLLPFLAMAMLTASACKAPQAFGDRHSLIVRAEKSLWARIDSTLMGALEQRVFTTRPERAFKVTFVAAADTLWRDLRVWQQVIVLGSRGDEAVDKILGAADQTDAQPPAIVQATGIWARTQLVTLLLLPETEQDAAVDALLPELYALLQAKYDEWILERMYTTGINDSLKQVLAGHGFTLELPQVYLYSHQDSVFRFSNPYRQGDSDLLRSLLLTWVTGTGSFSDESLRLWRESVDETYYEPGQDILDKGIRFEPVQVGGRRGLEFRGVWQDRGQFPAAGPFITRAIECPQQNRTYYLDAWLFAPGKDKYPYLRQLEILLDSFRCGEGGATVRSGTAPPAYTVG